jgi:hypothetical protein
MVCVFCATAYFTPEVTKAQYALTRVSMTTCIFIRFAHTYMKVVLEQLLTQG